MNKASINKDMYNYEELLAETVSVTKLGKSDLAEPIAIRPTSVTMI